MKTISTFLSLILTATVVFAQVQTDNTKGTSDVPRATDNISPKELPTISQQSSQKELKSSLAGCSDVIYSYDFANGIPTGWTNNGSPSTAVWEYRGPGTNPSNAVGSRGAYAGGTTTISSATANNGFMIFDSDYLDNGGNPNNMGGGSAPTPHIGMLQTGSLDFSSQPFVTLTLTSYFRTFVGEAEILISTNGGSTFSDTILVHTDLDLNESSDEDVPLRIRLDNEVGGQSNVVVAFFFDGRSGNNNNTNGDGYYFWQIDDIAFIGTPNNEIRAEGFTVSHDNKFSPYGTTPENFTSTIHHEGDVSNQGAEDQPNTGLSVITLRNGSQVGFDTTVIGTLPYNGTSTISTSSGFTPSAVGMYHSQLDFFSDSTDCTPSNNTFVDSFRVSEAGELYALDNNVVSGYMGTNTWTVGDNPPTQISTNDFQMLNLFEFSSVYELTNVWLRTSPITKAGGTAQVVVYDSSSFELGGSWTPNDEIYRSPLYTFTSSAGANNMDRIPVDVTLDPGEYYIGVEVSAGDGTDTVRIAVDESRELAGKAGVLFIQHPQFTNLTEGQMTGCFHLRLNSGRNCNAISISANVDVDDASFFGNIHIDGINGGEGAYLTWWTDTLGDEIDGTREYTTSGTDLNNREHRGTYTYHIIDKNGCKEEVEVLLRGDVGKDGDTNAVSEIGKSGANVSVYPNPSKGLVTVNFKDVKDGKYNVKISNAVGQTVYTDQVRVTNESSATLDLRGLSEGVYHIHVSGKETDHVSSFMIE